MPTVQCPASQETDSGEVGDDRDRQRALLRDGRRTPRRRHVQLTGDCGDHDVGVAVGRDERRLGPVVVVRVARRACHPASLRDADVTVPACVLGTQQAGG
jgi:hypothetical protein